MSRFRLMTLALFATVACSKKGELGHPLQNVPLSGRDSLPQIYFLTDDSEAARARRQTAAGWGEITRGGASSELPARIEFIDVKTLAEARDQLQVLNGRPVDVLFLGSGLPQTAWLELKLPQHPKRRVFAFEGVARSEWMALAVDRKQAESFVARLCAAQFLGAPCRTFPKSIASATPSPVAKPPVNITLGTQAAETTPDNDPVFLSVWVDWSEFLKSEVLGRNHFRDTGEAPPRRRLGFDSNLVKVAPGPALRNAAPALRQGFDVFYRQWSFQLLGSGAEKTGAPPADLLRPATPRGETSR